MTEQLVAVVLGTGSNMTAAGLAFKLCVLIELESPVTLDVLVSPELVPVGSFPSAEDCC